MTINKITLILTLISLAGCGGSRWLQRETLYENGQIKEQYYVRIGSGGEDIREGHYVLSS